MSILFSATDQITILQSKKHAEQWIGLLKKDMHSIGLHQSGQLIKLMRQLKYVIDFICTNLLLIKVNIICFEEIILRETSENDMKNTDMEQQFGLLLQEVYSQESIMMDLFQQELDLMEVHSWVEFSKDSLVRKQKIIL